MSRARIAVLASGRGSNLQALIDHFHALGERRAGDIVLVASDRPDAHALTRAATAGIATATIASRRAPAGDDLGALLERHRIDLLALAGYLQLVPAEITRAYAGRVVNVHPGPLPAFGGPGMYGSRVHRAVLASGRPFGGPTIHFVDEQYDHGATIAFWPVPVLAGDDEHALADRVLRAEHLLFPRVVQAVAGGLVRLEASGTVSAPFIRDESSLLPLDPRLDDSSLSRILDAAHSA